MNHSLINAPTSNVVVLAGPDNPVDLGPTEETARAYKAVSFSGIVDSLDRLFQLQNFNYDRIGNGDPNTLLDELAIEKIISVQPPGSLVIAIAHGLHHPKTGHLLVNFAADAEPEIIPGKPLPVIPTTRLFDMIRRSGRPMDIIMISCQSGVTHEAANCMLPRGSRFLTLGDSDENVNQFHAWQILNFSSMNEAIIQQEWGRLGKISFEKILFNTLLTSSGLKSESSPALTIAGSGTCRFADMLKNHHGKKFTPLEEFYVRARFA